jgi:hypothetical protein
MCKPDAASLYFPSNLSQYIYLNALCASWFPEFLFIMSALLAVHRVASEGVVTELLYVLQALKAKGGEAL